MHFSKIRRNQALGLLGILCLQILFSVFAFRGYHGGDDYRYTVLAAELLDDTGIDTSAFPAYFGVRAGLLVPMAASFKVFGTSELSAMVPQLFLALLGTLAMYLLTALLLGRRAALPAAAIYATMPYTLRSSGLILADFPAFHWSTVGLALLFAAMKAVRYNTWLAAASAVAFSASWLSKSSVMCLAPVIGVVLLQQLRSNRKAVAPVLTFVLVAGLILAGELFFYGASRGDPLYRLTALETTISEFEHLWEGSVSARRFLVEGPLSITSYGAFGPVALLAFVLLPFVLLSQARKREQAAMLLINLSFWLLFLALFFNFMTTSFEDYKPIRPTALYFLFITHPAILLVIATAFSVDQAIRKRVLQHRIGGLGKRLKRSPELAVLVALVLCAANLTLEMRHRKLNNQPLRSAVRWLDASGDNQPFVLNQKRVWELDFLGNEKRLGVLDRAPLEKLDQLLLEGDDLVVLSFGEEKVIEELLGEGSVAVSALKRVVEGGFQVFRVRLPAP